MSSTYGRKFDSLAHWWAIVENLHDEEHPDRDDCGGVGGCTAMRIAVRLEQQMIDTLEEWRVR